MNPQPERFSAPAWRRLRRLLAIVGVAALVAAVVAILVLWLVVGAMPLHMLVATAIGVAGSVLLGGGLMALVFMSAGTGHDEAVRSFRKERE